jgi:hypothetical protein
MIWYCASATSGAGTQPVVFVCVQDLLENPGKIIDRLLHAVVPLRLVSTWEADNRADKPSPPREKCERSSVVVPRKQRNDLCPSFSLGERGARG